MEAPYNYYGIDKTCLSRYFALDDLMQSPELSVVSLAILH